MDRKPSCSGLKPASDFHRRRRWRPTYGDNHVSQTLACCRSRSIAGLSCVGAHLGLRLGRRLAWGVAPRLGLGRPARRCWRTCLLRIWRLLCPRVGPDPLGTALAAGQPLLLINNSAQTFEAPAHAGASVFVSGPLAFGAASGDKRTCFRSRTSRSASPGGFWSTTARCRSHRIRASASSAATAPANRRCFGPFAASLRQKAGSSRCRRAGASAAWLRKHQTGRTV